MNMDWLHDYHNSGLILTVGLVVGACVIALILSLPLWVVFKARTKGARDAALRGIQRQSGCPICKGKLSPAEVLSGRMSIRQGGKGYWIGAARCESCGYVELFS